MENIDLLTRHGLFDAQVPRYTSYPTAPIFSQDVGAAFQSVAIAALDPAEPVSVYIHIPFCERLCWFCACRTQGTRTLSPVEQYIETVKQELAQMAALLPDGVQMGRLHWGGGTPTILPPALIHDLAQAAKATFPPAEKFEFSVEIDPTLVDDAKIAALASEGMNRASIGIQDFSPDVQAAIGREQPFEVTQACVQSLRAAGITSLNADLVYGLPYQTAEKITDTVQKVLELNPDRIALFGYAHVPHMAKRQKLIKEETLPSDTDRFALSTLAADMFCKAGYQAIGTDHFAKPDDELAQAATRGDLRRNFQGYTTDTCSTLIGVGASSISRFAQGYVQNAAATGAYTRRIQDGDLSGFRGHELTVEDKLRARVIEMLMCNFEIDDAELADTFGELAASLDATHAQALAKFDGVTERGPNGLRILPEGRALVRIIVQLYDGYSDTKAIFSKAS
ncbi:oxygen-independent coproporphyrinogen III oxidase [Octadecabacter sp. 1_MG-2023]|uniref:oxygen-independent coproporphyrinogen III oxidase n=1 Tax=unclassified Octadecabacter TaxID=196158 RepID=UPI001C083AEF|nr:MULTISPECIES: oxygen-independent coproporphyrinogen III oxidase [unclassified Octadecabacter]MBU2992885.1 oxygen-independent coproporphyrinogen III oxidase [Octadecabacter sp. B2R22]MDO6733664.1 oxygen-independent coproporphyrinogen III oxidase [Octadecabacter sp. 1_MG-2023]